MNVHKIIEDISKQLEGIPGIVGVVLGGSRARDTHRPTSDIDIGIYYDESAGFDVRELGKIAARLDDERRENLVSALGGWGPWINAGGWLVVKGYPVDLILRDVKRVSQVIEECLSGSVSAHYHAGHPHAYLNVMYMGEVAICKIISDPSHQIAELKKKTEPYPKAMQDAIIGYFMFEATFSVRFAEDNVDKDDVSYVCGCCFRALSCLNQVLFAKNKQYCINEKKAVAMVDRFEIKPHDYKNRIDQLVTLLSLDKGSTREGVDMLKDLIAETEKLLQG
ncbi:nucleotidyltransferase domain-containing protein [Paenibacillus sp. J2TS4]|uniref:nucleotidyltransferase domain-containing protein n=1 Tax=Paenibacillus sp. J2TS4 TaxID=2807194 RepID=UPI001B1E94B5|nr:nucleotidyltransferase domain-containing protein [Paenibacillus sp. J2TS4]GIP31793.1 hypothetical protein J2TS4_10030 [Paenibacillus sp. J2TS4]